MALPFRFGTGTVLNNLFAQQVDADFQAIAGGGAARVQRSVKTSGDLPIVITDNILNINATSDLAPVVPLASGQAGVPLTFKNLPGSNTQTLTRTSPDTFDGVTTYLLFGGSSVTLVPYNDGVNAGWAIE